MIFRAARIAGTLLTVSTAVLVTTALPAAAHNSLKSSTPQNGVTLDAAPAAASLTFAEELTPANTTITISGPDSAPATAGDPQYSGPTVNVPFKPTAAGAYTVTYRLISADGDPISNKISFTLSAAAIPSPTTTATTTTSTTTPQPTTTTPTQDTSAQQNDDGGTVWWPYLVGGLVIIAVAVVVVVRRRRGTQM